MKQFIKIPYKLLDVKKVSEVITYVALTTYATSNVCNVSHIKINRDYSIDTSLMYKYTQALQAHNLVDIEHRDNQTNIYKIIEHEYMQFSTDIYSIINIIENKDALSTFIKLYLISNAYRNIHYNISIISKSIQVSRPTLYKHLKTLQEKYLISITDKKIHLYDPLLENKLENINKEEEENMDAQRLRMLKQSAQIDTTDIAVKGQNERATKPKKTISEANLEAVGIEEWSAKHFLSYAKKINSKILINYAKDTKLIAELIQQQSNAVTRDLLEIYLTSPDVIEYPSIGNFTAISIQNALKEKKDKGKFPSWLLKNKKEADKPTPATSGAKVVVDEEKARARTERQQYILDQIAKRKNNIL